MIYFIMAVMALLAGHMCKVHRWKQLIAMYEETDINVLMHAMSLGQGMNLVLPWRVGDILRVYLSGRRLKNGYALSLATVIADLYMDTLTVGMTFLTLYVFGIHKGEITEIMWGYIFLSITVILITVIVFALKMHVKKIVRLTASVFNSILELKILYITYATFASLKSIFKKVNLGKIISLTGLMWGSYFFSYEMFAHFMQGQGSNITLTGVFKALFSFSGLSLFRESEFYLVYLIMPLLLLEGLFFLRKPQTQKSQYYHLLPQMNQNEKLAFLEIYFGNEEKKDYIDLYLEINRGVNVVQDYSAGSNATTMLCMDENRTFFRKYSFSEEAVRLQEQIQWLKKYRETIPVASVLKEVIGENYCYYDMEYKPDAVGFFRYIHTMPVDKSWDVLQEILETLQRDIHSKVYAYADRSSVEQYVNSKVRNNIDFCVCGGGRWIKSLMEYEEIVINGINYPNLRHYEKLLNCESLCNRFMAEKYSVIHGDLTIENIVCTYNNAKNWYLIDPNTENVHESAFLDYAKMLQSLHGGYEFLMMVKDVNIERNSINFLYTKSFAYGSLLEKYNKYLEEHFSVEEQISIYLHEAVHWLRLMPYKIKKDSRRAVVFYAGMLMVLHDIEKLIR